LANDLHNHLDRLHRCWLFPQNQNDDHWLFLLLLADFTKTIKIPLVNIFRNHSKADLEEPFTLAFPPLAGAAETTPPSLCFF